MNIAVDLHIHSGLSPCGEKEMTPNNIVNMACIKGLDAIAVTDHNSTRNLPALSQIAEAKGLLFIPGIEITTKEEVHLLALFENTADALSLQPLLESALPPIQNKPRVFGHQYVYDQEDEIIDEVKPLLLNALDLSIEEAVKEVRLRGGVAIPAHIDREAFSIISNLGFVSPHLEFTTVELTCKCQYKEMEERYPYLRNYKIIRSSDAHRLSDILEREIFLEVEAITARAVLNALKK